MVENKNIENRDDIKLSIITVSLNSVNTIEKTIQSIMLNNYLSDLRIIKKYINHNNHIFKKKEHS